MLTYPLNKLTQRITHILTDVYVVLHVARKKIERYIFSKDFDRFQTDVVPTGTRLMTHDRCVGDMYVHVVRGVWWRMATSSLGIGTHVENIHTRGL